MSGKSSNRYDAGFKAAVVAKVVDERVSIAKAARDHELSEETVRRWIRQSGKVAVETEAKTEAERMRALERENNRLRMELEVLKEAVGIFSQRPR